MPPAPRRESGFVARLLARLERSQHVFLAGLVAAFAIEIVVDWNSTFYEVNVLRGALREKASHYAAILRLAAEDPLARHDAAPLRELARKVMEDDEVMAVGFVDGTGAPLVSAGVDLAARWPKQLHRDLAAMQADPAAFRARVAASRHRDLFQSVTDGEDRAIAWITRSPLAPPPMPGGAAVAYQDRLYDEATRAEDRSVTWALARVGDEPARGVLLVAMKTAHLRQGIDKKLWKGLAITVFFLGVILVQQLGARRAKLRLLSLRDALAAARTAISAALPEAPPRVDGLTGALAFAQAERLGGTVFDFYVDGRSPRQLDLFVALPEGSGVDVAFASVFVRDEQRRLRRSLPDAAPEPLFAAVAAAYAEAPIHRRVDLLLLRLDLEAREVSGVVAGMAPPALLDGTGAEIAPEIAPLDFPIDGRMIDLPVRRFHAPLPPGAQLVFYSDGLAGDAAHPLSPGEVLRRVSDGAERPPEAVVAELEQLTRKREKNLPDDVLAILLRLS